MSDLHKNIVQMNTDLLQKLRDEGVYLGQNPDGSVRVTNDWAPVPRTSLIEQLKEHGVTVTTDVVNGKGVWGIVNHEGHLARSLKKQRDETADDITALLQKLDGCGIHATKNIDGKWSVDTKKVEYAAVSGQAEQYQRCVDMQYGRLFDLCNTLRDHGIETSVDPVGNVWKVNNTRLETVYKSLDLLLQTLWDTMGVRATAADHDSSWIIARPDFTLDLDVNGYITGFNELSKEPVYHSNVTVNGDGTVTITNCRIEPGEFVELGERFGIVANNMALAADAASWHLMAAVEGEVLVVDVCGQKFRLKYDTIFSHLLQTLHAAIVAASPARVD